MTLCVTYPFFVLYTCVLWCTSIQLIFFFLFPLDFFLKITISSCAPTCFSWFYCVYANYNYFIFVCLISRISAKSQQHKTFSYLKSIFCIFWIVPRISVHMIFFFIFLCGKLISQLCMLGIACFSFVCDLWWMLVLTVNSDNTLMNSCSPGALAM